VGAEATCDCRLLDGHSTKLLLVGAEHLTDRSYAGGPGRSLGRDAADALMVPAAEGGRKAGPTRMRTLLGRGRPRSALAYGCAEPTEQSNGES
jgi:hypothetical protein